MGESGTPEFHLDIGAILKGLDHGPQVEPVIAESEQTPVRESILDPTALVGSVLHRQLEAIPEPTVDDLAEAEADEPDGFLEDIFGEDEVDEEEFIGDAPEDVLTEPDFEDQAEVEIDEGAYSEPKSQASVIQPRAPSAAKPKRSRGDRAARSGSTDAYDDDLVRIYLREIGRWPLLTKEGEVELAQVIEAGKAAAVQFEQSKDTMSVAEKRALRRVIREGERAEQQFVQSNLRLVVSIAKKYQSSGLPLLDLIQEGNLGLLHGVEKFDWRKGFKFSTYGTWWIKQAITRGIANTGRVIRLPVHAGDTLTRVQKARARLELKTGRPATLAELSDEIEMPEGKLLEVLQFAGEPLSLSEPLRADGEATLGDLIPDRGSQDGFNEVERQADLMSGLEEALANLDHRERTILRLRFGLDDGQARTLEEVGEHFNLTRERIRQIESRAMAKLRHPSMSVFMGALALHLPE